MNEVHFGTVTSVDGFYRIVYDDGDEEDMDQKGLQKALALYKSCVSTDISIGSRVIVNQNNKLYEGCILECREKDEKKQSLLQIDGQKKSSASWVNLYRPSIESTGTFGDVGFKFFKRFETLWLAGEVVEIVSGAGERLIYFSTTYVLSFRLNSYVHVPSYSIRERSTHQL